MVGAAPPSRASGKGIAVERKSELLTCYLAHRGDLLKYAAGITGDRVHAEDLLQEVWIRCQSADRPDRPLNFLYRLVRTLAVDKYRAQSRDRKRFVQADDAVTASVPAFDAGGEADIAGKEELRIVESALAELPEDMRRAVMLYRFEGWKLREVAEELGLTIGAVHGLVAKGLKHCRSRLHPPE